MRPHPGERSSRVIAAYRRAVPNRIYGQEQRASHGDAGAMLVGNDGLSRALGMPRDQPFPHPDSLEVTRTGGR